MIMAGSWSSGKHQSLSQQRLEGWKSCRSCTLLSWNENVDALVVSHNNFYINTSRLQIPYQCRSLVPNRFLLLLFLGFLNSFDFFMSKFSSWSTDHLDQFLSLLVQACEWTLLLIWMSFEVIICLSLLIAGSLACDFCYRFVEPFAGLKEI